MKNIYSINYASFHVYGSVHPKQMMSYAFQRFPLLLSFNFLYRKYRFICCLNKITINIDTTRWTNSKFDFINGLKWKKSEMIYRLHACIFKNTKKGFAFLIKFCHFSETLCFDFLTKIFDLWKKIFEKNLFYNLKYFFKCRMCQIWSLKWQNFVKNANPFLYSWRYIHAMYKSLQFSIISNHL